MKKKIIFILAVSCILSFPYNLFAWGMGHNSQTDQVWKSLPESFRKHFTEKQRQDFVKYYSHYTDYYASRTKPNRSEPSAKCCAETVTMMKFNPHKTHIVFPLFVEAWREKRYEDALMWAGCLSHSIGDMGALNHPDMLWFSGACLGYSGVIGPGGKTFNSVFAPDMVYYKSYFNKKLQTLYDKEMSGYHGNIISGTPQEVLEHIMVRDHFRKEEMNTNPFVYQIFMLMEQYNKDKSSETYAKIAESLAKYTQEANKEILDTIITGVALAEKAEKAEFHGKVAERNAANKVQAISRKKTTKAQDMIIFTNIWRDEPVKGSVGVIISDKGSLVYTAGCKFGSKHQWLTSIILHGLKSENIPYQCLSYERPEKLDPAQNPVIIVVAPKIRDTLNEKFIASLIDYTRSGGRLIWLGGKVPAKLAALLPKGEIRQKVKGDHFLFPFPILDKKKKSEAVFVRKPDEKRFPVADIAFQRFSWNTFMESRCLVFEEFENSPDKETIMRLEAPGIDQTIGVQVKIGEGEIIYLPWFVICPYMLSDQRVMESLVNLGLDPTGKNILFPYLKEKAPLATEVK